MRIQAAVLIITVALSGTACSRRTEPEQKDPAARKMGRAAYEITKESEKLAKKAGEKLKEATHEAHQGWKEAQQEDRSKHSR
jgi:hypothetical protein